MQFRFSEDFVFGAATSAAQIEGRQQEDGSGDSIWSSFLKEYAGKAAIDYETNCHHLAHWKEDVALMKSLNLDSYRFSVSWPRVIPEGAGSYNQAGLAFYDRLVDELLESGITPLVTLYHWDLPQKLQDKGGWANPNSPDWFCQYTQAMADTIGDRVSSWVTFNEPWVFMHLGMISGEHAPGMQSVPEAAKAYKHILLSHARSASLIKSYEGIQQVGIASNLSPFRPASQSEDDVAACNRMEAYHNRLFLDAWVDGTIPEVSDDVFQQYNPSWTETELNELSDSLDFIGVNYYTSKTIAHQDGQFLSLKELPAEGDVTGMNWGIDPKGLLHTLSWAYQTYRLPLYVTENGAAFSDTVENGQVHDENRARYIMSHLEQCSEAINQNIPLKGYYVWSLLDNYEWNCGFDQRFGLIHVDFNTLQRTIKKSGYCYREVINDKNHQDTAEVLNAETNEPEKLSRPKEKQAGDENQNQSLSTETKGSVLNKSLLTV